MKEEEEGLESIESLEDKVSSFTSGIDESLSLRLMDIKKRQERELETLKHDVMIARTLFEVEMKRSLDGADEKTLFSLSRSYWNLDLGDDYD